MGRCIRSVRSRLSAVRPAVMVATLLAVPAAAQQETPVEEPPVDDPDVVAPDVQVRGASGLLRMAFRAHDVAGETIDERDIAEAYDACEECREVAGETLLIFAAADPDPDEGCPLCERLGSVYRWALGLAGIVSFTEQGHRELVEVGAQLRDDPTEEDLEGFRGDIVRILEEHRVRGQEGS